MLSQLTPWAAQGKTLAVILNFVFYFAHILYPGYQQVLPAKHIWNAGSPPHIFCYSFSHTPPIFSKAKPWFCLFRWLQELLPGLPVSLLASIYPTLYRTHKVSPQKLLLTPFSLKVKAKFLERPKKPCPICSTPHPPYLPGLFLAHSIPTALVSSGCLPTSHPLHEVSHSHLVYHDNPLSARAPHPPSPLIFPLAFVVVLKFFNKL